MGAEFNFPVLAGAAIPKVGDNPWFEILNENVSLSTAFAIPAGLMGLVRRINESQALAIHAILKQNGTESFNIVSMDIYNQAEDVATPIQGKRLYRVSGDSRGGQLLPPLNSMHEDVAESVSGRSSGRPIPIAPLIITSPTHEVRLISTATETLNWTIIYDWVQHPFPAQMKAMLLGELRGAIRQVNVERFAGDQYFQIPVIKQIGGGQA